MLRGSRLWRRCWGGMSLKVLRSHPGWLKANIAIAPEIGGCFPEIGWWVTSIYELWCEIEPHFVCGKMPGPTIATCVCEASVVHVSEDISKVAPWVGPSNTPSKVWFQTSHQPETRCLVSFIMPFTVYYAALPYAPQIKSVTILAQARCLHNSTARTGEMTNPLGSGANGSAPPCTKGSKDDAIDRKSNEIAKLNRRVGGRGTRGSQDRRDGGGSLREGLDQTSCTRVFWWILVVSGRVLLWDWTMWLVELPGRKHWERVLVARQWKMVLGRILMNGALPRVDIRFDRFSLRAACSHKATPCTWRQHAEWRDGPMARFLPSKNGLFLSRQIQHRPKKTPTDCAIPNRFVLPKALPRSPWKDFLVVCSLSGSKCAPKSVEEGSLVLSKQDMLHMLKHVVGA